MKNILKAMIAAAVMLLPTLAPAQTTTPPDREFRSAWVATVWRLDWPQTTITSTGNQSQIQKQKDQMIQLLDSLSTNNFNAINFQVRSRSDAMYRSSYEPWSSDLVDSRGMDPGWDPLEFVVAECHRRGMECHAWVNPYRFESVSHQWDNTPMNYRDTHPDWVMDVTNSNGTASILNPGLPEVTDHICNIIREIVTNYDVDGVLFDDYFYLSGTNESHDGDLWNAYKANGGKLSIKDWRRANVNNMVARVNQTIKAAKPWVRFGVSPAGIACTSSAVAAQYGISPCPTGSDWQYNDIYSDPIAWISQQSIDFISPQIYWTRGASTDYNKASKWWSEVAHKWNRHLYVSHSISSLTGSSKSPQMSGIENEIASAAAETTEPDYASGPNNDSFQEYVEQILLNRAYNLDNAPGSIFYSAKYLYRTAKLFSHYLKQKAFTTHCLPPAMTWCGAPTPDPVENVMVSGSKLMWNAVEGMRYTVYAYPASFSDSEKIRMPEYLLGVAYKAEFDIPEEYLGDYTYGVCAYDRFGNESSLAIPGSAGETLAAPVIVFPAADGQAEAPFDFQWQAVEGASEYIVEIALDAAMTQRLDQRSTTTPSISTSRFVQLPLETPLYWRVRACSPGYRDGIGQANGFTLTELRITSPQHGVTLSDLTPTFEYSIAGREVTLEIADDMAFDDEDIVYTSTHTGAHNIPQYILCSGKHFFARARYTKNGETLTTATVEFDTPEFEAAIPSVAYPVPGGDLHSDEHIRLVPVEGPYQFRIEVSESNTFPPRKSYSTVRVSTFDFTDPTQASDIKISTKHLVDGVTYYLHARARYWIGGTGEVTGYSEPIPFVYRASSSGLDDVVATVGALRADNGCIEALEAVESVTVTSPDGRTVAIIGNMAAGERTELNLPAGVYIVGARNVQPIKTTIH